MNEIAALLNKQRILDEAVNRSGLSDFGDLFFDEALERLLTSLVNEANLSIEGAYGQYERTVNLLVNRLRMEEAFKTHPEIDNEQIDAPVIIVGLPRTGTTLLSRILSSNPEFYTLHWWECRNPSPFPVDQAQPVPARDVRIDAAEAMIKEILDAVPELASIHPFDAEGHDEEILLMEHSFYSTVPEASAWVPSYQAWLEQQDQTKAYADLKRMLKFLQWQKNQRGIHAKRWVLKTPHHLHFMAELHDCFPDALLIQTHRNPVETIPSLASMYDYLYQLVSADVDRHALGRTLLEKWSNSMNRCLTFRVTTKARMLDVNYLDTVKSPKEVVRRIFDEIGFDFTQDTQGHIDAWLDENQRDSRAKHDYNLADYGLNQDELVKRFQDYNDEFITP
ncbi:MAG: sulfotransferase [Pseudomonadota bacterium]